MSLADVLTALLKTNADASSDNLEKVLLGTPGSSLMYPSTAADDSLVADSIEQGRMWEESPFLPALLEALGQLLDGFLITWGYISTMGAGIAPVVNGHHNVASASKNEPADTITVTIDTNYDSAYYAVFASSLGSLHIPLISGLAAGSFSVAVYDDAGVLQDINMRNITVVCFGQSS